MWPIHNIYDISETCNINGVKHSHVLHDDVIVLQVAAASHCSTVSATGQQR